MVDGNIIFLYFGGSNIIFADCIIYYEYRNTKSFYVQFKVKEKWSCKFNVWNRLLAKYKG